MPENELIINANNQNIMRRLVFIACFLFVDFLIINHLLINKRGPKGVILLIFLIILLTSVLFPVLMSLFRITRIRIDTQSDILLFKQLLKKRKYAVHNIIGYNTTFYKSQRKNYLGLILKLDNHTVIELAGQNLEKLEELQDYLTARKVPFLGEKTSFFPFRRPS